ncbi:hypothetical protein Scep_029323 [Stephania cephalantha]|uniref:Uncharacterized protein n=1 Tax=Stephania cephalantha TaxID=152367 RepID=A0AAP0E113_9MAGN
MVGVVGGLGVIGKDGRCSVFPFENPRNSIFTQKMENGEVIFFKFFLNWSRKNKFMRTELIPPTSEPPLGK